MRKGRVKLLVAILAAGALAGALDASAQTPATFTLDASATEPGWIALSATGTTGATVAITSHGTTVTEFTLTTATGGRRHAAPWRCTRRTQTFTATETLDDGSTQAATASVTTPACNAGLTVSTWPQPPRVGRPLQITVTSTRAADRRQVTACAVRGATKVCRSAALATGAAAVSLILPRPGMWHLHLNGHGIASQLPVNAGRRPLTVLATGDSEIQVLDDQMAAALRGRARVIGEAHISTGLSKLGLFNWLKRAQTQAQTIHPDVTVMSIGANDGFPISGAQCCGQPWIDAYAARARQMMRSYLRHGAGRVYWFLLPTPRRANFVPVYQAVDAGFIKAAASFPGQAHVVDIRPIFSPGGHYRQFVGSVNARESDGIHLSAAGDQIALQYLLGLMRQDRTL
jgi:lysophospholipase L1-like esterase